MSFRLVSEGWGTELEDALRRDRSDLRIVSPFIKGPALQRLLAIRPERIRVVTRFDLEGFARGVSDVAVLRTLLEFGAGVRGLRGLHAKLYVFGDSVAVVTSANLTVSGLDRNPEFGLVTEDPAAIQSCLDHFEALWHRARDDLRIDQVEQWTGEPRSPPCFRRGPRGDEVSPRLRGRCRSARAVSGPRSFPLQ